MKIAIKLILAVLLLLCLADMPYGYYTLVRFVSAFAFVYFAYEYYKANQGALVFVFLVLSVLFQPFIKVALGRDMWNVVDVLVAIGLICLAFHQRKKKLI